MIMDKQKSVIKGRGVYIVDGCRTPFLKAKGTPGPFTASDLAVAAGRVLLERQPFAPTELDEVVTGCAMPSPDEANIGRVISLRLGCGKAVPAWTVMRNCASGMQALDSAAQNISLGRQNLILAGGVDAMSHSPLLFKEAMVVWFAKWAQSRTIGQKLKVLAQIKPGYLSPIIALIHGLTDPVVGLSMGQTAENLAFRFGITRRQMDEFAVRSHQRLTAAQAAHVLSEITTIYDKNGHFYQHDDGVRPESTVEKLAKLKPFFDKKFGAVTAGNSSQITDGSALLILASADAVRRYQLPILGRIVDTAWAGVDPAEMGIGPVFASTALLQRHGLTRKDIDYWEINEAFAAQVLACLAAWDDAEFCRRNLGLADKFGRIDEEKLNIYGDAIAMGHPIGASGARVVLQLIHILKRNNAKRGVAALCIGGGQGGAMLIENVDKVSEGD
jgi:acetyl-CoA C-acetyltransferase